MDKDILNFIDNNAKNIRTILVSREFDNDEKKDMIKIAVNNILKCLNLC